jgi:hypothetical protein
LLIFILIITFFLMPLFVYAQEQSDVSSKSATVSGVLDDKVKALKEKLATKVAELKENNTRGFFGEIATLTKTSFTLATDKQEVKVRFDENTLIYKLTDKKTEGAVKDLKNTITASVLGLYDDEAKQQTAKFIILQNLPKFYSGEITQIDKTNAIITIKNAKNETLSFDYEKTTIADEYFALDKKFKKSGMSRLSVGDKLQLWANPKVDDNEKFSIVKLVRLPIDLFITTPLPTALPSSAASTSVLPKSSAKPSPTAKTTPKPTPKSSPKSSPVASP